MHIESRFDVRSSKHTGENKKSVRGDSMYDLDCSEFPTSRGENEAQKMKKEDLCIERRTWEWHTGETKIQRIQVRFTVESLKRIEDMAASLRISRVEFIRAAVDYVVNHLESH